MFDYDDYDYYSEPSEFERQIMEFKASLVSAVKKEHQEEMERLREENKSLQEVKARIKEIEKEHRNAMRDIEQERSKIEQNVKRMRLNELLSENFVQGWGVVNNGEMLPKCDKCDKDRYIHYKTPSGREAQERCSCGACEIRYEPKQVKCFQFTHAHKIYSGETSSRVRFYYTMMGRDGYDEYSCTTNVYNGKPFEEVNRYEIVFLDKEECQKYCNWLNDKNK